MASGRRDELKAAAQRLLAYGTDIYPPRIARRLRVLNGMAYLIAIFSAHYAVTYALADFQKYQPFVWLNLALVGVGLSIPFLHRFHELAGAGVVCVAEFSALFAFTAMLGRDAGTHINLIVGAAAPFFVFGLHRRALNAAVIGLSFAVHVSAWFLFPPGRAMIEADQYLLDQLYVSSAMATFAVVAALVYYAFSLAEQAEAATEALLRNVLPGPVVDRLQARPERQIFDSFDDVPVLFTDLEGFVSIARKLGAQRTVELLNALVSAFDALAEVHGVEKIKTIGDSYMAAAGVPARARGDEVARILRFALAIQEAARDIEERFAVALPMRVGVAAGPVMAGIIGSQKFSYDVWGDAVNLAARLEASGEPGRIHVSGAVRERCVGLFGFEERRMIEVKGFGPVESWFLAPADRAKGETGGR